MAGKVEGEVEATGDIEVAGGGTVSGTITAYNRLVVGGGASLIGSEVRVGRLTVEDGATFSGHVSMGKAAIKAQKAMAEPAPAMAPEPAAPEAMAAPEPQTEAIEVVTPVVDSEPTKKGKRR